MQNTKPDPAVRISTSSIFARSWIQFGSALLILTAATLATFHQLDRPGAVMQSGDNPPVRAQMQRQMLEEGFRVAWNPYSEGLGATGEFASGDWLSLVYRLGPGLKTIEWTLAVSLFLSGLFFYLFLHERRYGFWPAIIGGVAIAFSSSLATFTSAGHVGRLASMAHVAAALWCMQRALHRRSWVAGGFAGYFAAMGLISDGTTGLLLLLAAGLFWIREIVVLARVGSLKWLTGGMILATAGLVAIVIVTPQIFILKAALGNANDQHAQANKTPSQQWNWATQWSYPPDELIGFICPTYFGLDSWNPQAPYWGRLGQSPEWTQVPPKERLERELKRNFSQTNPYLGVIVFCLALTALFAFLPRRNSQTLADTEDSPSNDTLFWSLIGVVALLHAFGRFFPLPFKLFTSLPLPLISSFRNPVKFIVVINLAIAMLAAQGAYAVLNRPLLRVRNAFLIAAAVLTTLFGWALLNAPWDDPVLISYLQANGWAPDLDVIASAMRSGLLTSLLLSALCVVLAAAAARLAPGRWVSAGTAAVLLLLAVLDLSAVNRLYVRYDRMASVYPSNVLIELARETPEYRLKYFPDMNEAMMIAQANRRYHPGSLMNLAAIFSQWNSQLHRFYGVRGTDPENPASAPVSDFYNTLSTMPGRLWQMTGTRHIVTPRDLVPILKTTLGNAFREGRGIDLTQNSGGGFTPAWAADSTGGQFVVVENTAAWATPRWYSTAVQYTGTGIPPQLNDPSFDPSATLILDTIVPAADVPTAVTAQVALVEYSLNRIRATCTADQPGWMLFNDAFAPHWQARIDGLTTTVHRAFGVLRAVHVPAGSHTVELTYRHPATPFNIAAGALGFLSLGLVVSRVWRMTSWGRQPTRNI